MTACPACSASSFSASSERPSDGARRLCSPCNFNPGLASAAGCVCQHLSARAVLAASARPPCSSAARAIGSHQLKGGGGAELPSLVAARRAGPEHGLAGAPDPAASALRVARRRCSNSNSSRRRQVRAPAAAPDPLTQPPPAAGRAGGTTAARLPAAKPCRLLVLPPSHLTPNLQVRQRRLPGRRLPRSSSSSRPRRRRR